MALTPTEKAQIREYIAANRLTPADLVAIGGDDAHARTILATWLPEAAEREAADILYAQGQAIALQEKIKNATVRHSLLTRHP